MSILADIACWLAPPRLAEMRAMERRMAEAQAQLDKAKAAEPHIRAVVRAHVTDRQINHYGLRIRRALRGERP